MVVTGCETSSHANRPRERPDFHRHAYERGRQVARASGRIRFYCIDRRLSISAGLRRAGAIGVKSEARVGSSISTLCLRAIAVGVVTEPHGTGITAKPATSNVRRSGRPEQPKFPLLRLLKGDLVGFVQRALSA